MFFWNGVGTVKKLLFIATAVALFGWMLLATANVSGAILGAYDEKKTEEQDKCCVADEQEKKEDKDKVTMAAGDDTEKKEEKDKKYHRIERSYGNFLRSFALPEGADGGKVAADFKDGVLKVHLPKSEKAKAKAVEVKVA